MFALTEHNVRFCGDTMEMGSSDNYGCAFFDETLMLGVVMFTAGPGNMFLIYLFSQVNDAFKLRVEFIWIYAVISLATGEMTELHCNILSRQPCGDV